MSGALTWSVSSFVSRRVPSAEGSVETPVAVTVNVESPAADGVPAINPSLFRVRPAGSDPLVSDQVITDRTPPACSPAEYGEPAIAAGRDSVEIENRLGQMSNVKRSSALCLQ